MKTSYTNLTEAIIDAIDLVQTETMIPDYAVGANRIFSILQSVAIEGSHFDRKHPSLAAVFNALCNSLSGLRIFEYVSADSNDIYFRLRGQKSNMYEIASESIHEAVRERETYPYPFSAGHVHTPNFDLLVSKANMAISQLHVTMSKKDEEQSSQKDVSKRTNPIHSA